MSEERKWQCLIVEDKPTLINQYENDAWFAKIARDKGMNESTAWTMVKKKRKV